MRSAPERRFALIEEILDYGETTIDNLAFVFHVSRSAIERDLRYLETTSFFGALFEKIPGRGGGVRPNPEWREKHWTVDAEDEPTFQEMMNDENVDPKYKKAVKNLLRKHGRNR